MEGAMEGFEFESDSLSYGTIENEICDYYNLGYANSSTFMELSVGKGQRISISAEKGYISCFINAYQKKDSERYIVTISQIDIKYKRR